MLKHYFLTVLCRFLQTAFLVIAVPILGIAQTNIAPQAVVTATGTGAAGCQTGPCSTVNDLNLGNCGTQQMWISTMGPPSTTPGDDYIQFDFPIPKTFDEIIIHHATANTARFLTGGLIQYWDGTNWITHHHFTNLPNQCINSIPFQKLTAERFRITSFELNGPGQLSNPNFREIEVISAPTAFNDAMAQSTSPEVFCPGMNDVFATIGNYGLNQINSVEIHWEINGIVMPTIFHGQLIDTLNGAFPNTVQIHLGSVNLNSGANILKVYTANPNGATDGFVLNDTIEVILQTLTAPLDFSLSNPTISSIDVDVNGSTSTIEYEYGPVGFIPGNGTVGVANSNPFTIANLNPATQYDLYVRNACGTSSSSYIGPVEFITECVPFTAPYSEDFDGAQAVIPFSGIPCWKTTGPGANDIHLVTTPDLATINIPSSPNIVEFNEGYFQSDTSLLVSPAFSDIGTAKNRIRFKVAFESIDSAEAMYVGVMSDPMDASTFIPIDTLNSSDIGGVNGFGEVVINLTDTALYGSSQYIAFAHGDGPGAYELYLDDFHYEAIPSCVKPSNLSASNITLNSAVIDWTENNVATEWEIEYGPRGFSKGNGIDSLIVSKPFAITGLAPSTGYEFYIRSICGRGDTSYWEGPFIFMTAIGVPYTQDFENFGSNLAGINNIEGWNNTATAAPEWETGTTTSSVSTGPVQDHTIGAGGTFVYLETSGGALGDFDSLVSPSIYVDTAINGLTLEFWYHMYGSTMGDLEVYIDSNGTKNLITTLVGQQQTSETDPWLLFSTQLSGYEGSSVRLIFKGIRGSNYYSDMSIDDIRLIETPAPCSGQPDPVTITGPSSVCAGVDFVLETTGASMGTGISYSWEYYDSTASAWIPIGGTLPRQHISGGIFAPTSYRFITTCSNSSISDTSNVFSITMNSPNQCYCHAIYTTGCTVGDDIRSVIINGVNGTGINDLNTACSPNNYDDKTSLPPVDLVKGMSHNAAINSNYTGLYEYAKVWIDFNDDGFFADSTELVGQVGPFSTTLVPFTMTIPATADSGLHRMRVRCVYAGSAFAFDACSSESYGEVHDYMANVVTPQCPVPSSQAADLITTNSAVLSWVETGISTTWAVEYGTSGFTLGTGIDTITTSNPLSISNLSPGTRYDYYVRSICGRGDSSFFMGPFTFITECISVSNFPYVENFDGNFSDGTWDCWTIYNNDGGDTWVQDNLYLTARSTPYVAHGMGNNNDMLISPRFDLPSTPMWIRLYDIVESSTYNSIYSVLVSTTGKDSVDFTDTLMTFDVSNTTWEERTIDLSAYANQSIYIALWQSYSASASWAFGIDDFTVETKPTCVKPSGFSALNIGLTSADISWLENNLATEWEIEYGPLGFTQGTGSGSIVNTNPTSISGLAPGSSYDIYIRSICGRGDTSKWEGPFTFMTSIGIPFSEDFENFGNSINSNGWSMISASALPWQIGTTTTSGSTGPDQDHTIGTGGTFAFLETSSGATGDTAHLLTPPIFVDTNLTDVNFEFWYHKYGATMDELLVYVESNGVSSLLTSILGQTQTSGTDPWLQFDTVLTGYAGQSVQIRFSGIRGSSFTGDMAIDDVSLSVDVPIDGGLTSFVSPTVQTCYTTAENVVVELMNYGADTLDFSVDSALVTVDVSGASNQTISFMINNNSLNSGNPLVPFTSITVPVGTVDMTNPGTYYFDATLDILNDGLSANDAIRDTVEGSMPGTLAGATSLCLGDSATLFVTGYRGNVQWQSSTGGAFADIAGATGNSIKVGPTSSVQYRVISCGSLVSDTLTVNPTIPVVPVANDSMLTVSCGNSGIVALVATSTNANAKFEWYSTSTGGSALRVGGNIYDISLYGDTLYYQATPSQGIQSIDTFYVQEVVLSGSGICASSRDSAVAIIDCLVGIEEAAELDLNISIYPNPSKGIFNIVGSNVKEEVEISIFNTNGKLVYESAEKLSNNFEQRIDISDFAKGLYFVKLQGQSSVEMKKIVVQ